MRRHDLRQAREQTDREICRSYQRRVLHEIEITSMNQTNPTFNVGEAINTCLDHIHRLIVFF